MTKIFFHPDGTPSPNPTDLQSAKKLRKPRYDDQNACPACGACSIKYTANGRCIHCARLEAMHFYNAVACNIPLPDGMEPTDDMKLAYAPHDHPVDLFPKGPAQALATGGTVWVRVEPCRTHGHVGVRTLDGCCYLCESGKAKAPPSPRQQALRSGAKWYTPEAACPYCEQVADKRVADGLCSGCAPAKSANSARADARRRGGTWYTPTDPCADCGQTAERRVADNRCRVCRPMASDTPSPRQQALCNGDKWYTPTTPCPRCDTHAARRVADGACSHCIQADTAPDPSTVMMESFPDLVIQRKEARDADLLVYRTGKPCKHGHTAWRYVSTGGCLTCLGRL